MRILHSGFTALLTVIMTLLASSALADPGALAQRKGCGICHHADMRMLGPSWAEIGERYSGDDGAAEMLFKRTREGSKGSTGDHWDGAPKMGVDVDTISDEDLRTVIAWVLAEKDASP